jgi:hypothetical protein
VIRLWRWGGPAIAVIVAAAVGMSAAQSGSAAATSEPDPVEVSSNPVLLTSLVELVEVADVVVRAEVAATERGRLFGQPGGASIQSRLVTLEVREVVAGDASVGEALLVEEEGWLDDGTPLVVDGVAPSAVGDDGVWFLQQVGDPDVPRWVTVSAQGRYLVDGDGLRGPAGDDPLVMDLASGALDALRAQIAALPH